MEFLTSHSGEHWSDEMTLTSSVFNSYIPMGNVQLEGHLLVDEREDEIYYTKPSIEAHCVIEKRNTIRFIMEGLQYQLIPYKIKINNKNYYFSKGLITNERNEVILVLAMRKEAFFDPSVPRWEPMVKSYKHHALFIASTFFTDSKLAPLSRRLQKDVLEPCYKKGIEVKILDPALIESNTFARPFEIKISSINNLQEFLKTKLSTYLYTTEEDSVVQEETIINPITEIPESILMNVDAIPFSELVLSLADRLRITEEERVEALRIQRQLHLQQSEAARQQAREYPATPEDVFPIELRPNVVITPGTDFIPVNTDDYQWADPDETILSTTNSDLIMANTLANLATNPDSYEWVEPTEDEYRMAAANGSVVMWRSRRIGTRRQTLELVDDTIELIDDTEV